LDSWEIAIRAFSRVKDVPTEVGSPLIVQYVEDGATFIEQATGQSVDLTAVASKFHAPLTAFAAGMICGYKEGVGVSYNLGTMRIDKSTELDGASRLMEQQLNLFNMGISALGKKMSFEKTEPKDSVN
jgi:hypothetical protein